jgi:hypothetical protein
MKELKERGVSHENNVCHITRNFTIKEEDHSEIDIES